MLVLERSALYADNTYENATTKAATLQQVRTCYDTRVTIMMIASTYQNERDGGTNDKRSMLRRRIPKLVYSVRS